MAELLGWAGRNAAKTHCPQGHPYSGSNLGTTKEGYRKCRTCSRAHPALRELKARKHSIIQDYKYVNGCFQCGEDDPVVLDLHHRDPSGKHRSLRRNGAAWHVRLSWPDLFAELEKCDVVCANCHRRLERGSDG